MNNKKQLGLFSFLCWIVSLSVLLTGCPSGGGGGGNFTSTPGLGFDVGSRLPFRILTLDYATGPLAAGSLVPLACITGGSIVGGHGLNCEEPHLHDMINILDLGGPYSDPNQLNCGHGKLSFAVYNALTYRCDLVDAPSAQVVIDELSLFSVAMVQLFLVGNTGSIPDLTIDINGRLAMKGTIPIAESADLAYDRLQILTACFRGFNTSTGENEVVHEKHMMDLPLTESKYIKLGCTPYSSDVSASLDVNLSADFSGGMFLTGGRNNLSQPLLGNGTTSFSVSAKPYETDKTAMVIGYGATGWYSRSLKYNPQTVGTVSINANSANMQLMQDVNIIDTSYMAEPDYLGITTNVKYSDMFKAYYDLAPDSPPAGSRAVPIDTNLPALGGITKIQASFATIDTMTNVEQTARVVKYQNGLTDIAFNESKPVYLTEGDINYVTPTFSGFNFGVSYTPNIAGQEPVKLNVTAETYDAINNTRYIWRGENYGSFGSTDMEYSDAYLNLSGSIGYAPTQNDVTRIGLQYSSIPDVAVRHELLDEYPPDELNGSTSVRLGLNF